MRRVRLVATDLDGTLLDHQGLTSARNHSALAAARAAGITIVVVTGRPPRSMREIAERVGASGLAVCCNGAIVYDVASQQLVRHHPLDPTIAQELVSRLREALPEVCFAVELGLRFGCEPRYLQLRPVVARLGQPTVDEALALCQAPVTKLIAFDPSRPADQMLPIVRRIAGQTAAVTHSGAPFAEISAPAVNKAQALAWICHQHAVTAPEVIAFGDMPNDLAMLEWAGHAVAVANAHPAVLAVVQERTLANTDDGVALVLERLQQQDWRLPPVATSQPG